MELELEYSAGYLPYGVKAEIERLFYPRWKVIYTLSVKELYEYRSKGYNIKLILHPLSDLTKKIGKFCFEEWVDESSCPEEIEQYTNCIYEKLSDGSAIDLDYLSYRIIKKMYEYHFDIYGLIEAGLAIDINTLNK